MLRDSIRNISSTALKIIISLQITVSLSSALSCKNIHCGSSLSLLEGVINSSPFTTDCLQSPVQYAPVIKAVKIESLEQLIDYLGLEKNLFLFQIPFIRKLLRDENFNAYTISILLYIKIPEYQERVDQNATQSLDLMIKQIGKKRFQKQFGEGYLSAVQRGREFIGIIHIRTKSANDYQKIDEKIEHTLHEYNSDKLEKTLIEISADHIMNIKNYLSDECQIPAATDPIALLKSAKTFLLSKCISSDIVKTKMELFPIGNIKELKKALKAQTDLIEVFLKCKRKINSLRYIEKHPEEFKGIPDLETYDRLSSSIMSIENSIIKRHLDINESKRTLIACLNYPNSLLRYKNLIPQKAISLPKREFAFILKKHNDLFRIVGLKKKLDYHYKATIDITKNGKVLILNELHTLLFNNSEIFRQKNAHILFDTYVNFPGLRFKRINSVKFGTLKFSFDYDRFSQFSKINGSSVIDKAECGYEVEDSNGTLKFICKEITFKPLSISFKHEEDIDENIDKNDIKGIEEILNRRRPTFPHQ